MDAARSLVSSAPHVRAHGIVTWTTVDITGLRSGRLTVVERAGRNKHGASMWLCKCDCGNERVIAQSNIRKGQQSCGCLLTEVLRARTGSTNPNYQGGDRNWKNPTYASWRSMRTRCENPRASDYPRYGGRGILICERWIDFGAFVEDMGERPEGKTLDRLDVNGNYEPGNCRWASAIEQRRNQRRVVMP